MNARVTNTRVTNTRVATDPRQPAVRYHLVRALLLLGVVGLAWRVVDLQVLSRDFLQHQGVQRHVRLMETPAHRGIVHDRNGEPLAISTPVESIWAHPAELLEADAAKLARLARALDLKPRQLRATLRERAGREFVWLKRQVAPDVVARIDALELPGVGMQREYRRFYPGGEVTAHVLGFTSIDDVGQEGVELAYEDWLRGRPGQRRVIRDRLGRAVETVESLQPPRPGQPLVLSIDRRIQYLAYRELKAAVTEARAQAGSAVVLDARTGEVLAIVNQPSLNPNDRRQLQIDRYRNRAVTDLFEPGSTLKPFTVAAGLMSGRMRADTQFDTGPGLLRVGNHVVRDVHNYGTLSVAEVLAKSSNVGSTKIALAIAPQHFWELLSGVGFGRVVGSGFPGEQAGLLPPYAQWGEVMRATLSYGYGLSATPLQLAQSYVALAHEGERLPVSLLRTAQAPAGTRVIERAVALQVRAMMEGVVQPGGTAPQAAIAGYRVAGKTGTSRKAIPGGYSEDRYQAIFAGMAPASDPRLVMVVMIDEPQGERYYGGQVAAPVFGRVIGGALRLLDIAPDNLPPERPDLHAVVARRVAG